jgi:hypothetical protein
MNYLFNFWINTVLGDEEKIFEYLDKKSEFFAEENWSLYLMLKNDPIYDNIRSDLRFKSVLAKHKKLDEENRSKYKL